MVFGKAGTKFTNPWIMLKPKETLILIRCVGVVIAVSAVELLISAAVFHADVVYSRNLTTNYTFVMKQYVDMSKKNELLRFHDWYKLTPAFCNYHFLDFWFLLLAFVTVILSLYQLWLAFWGTAVTFVVRERDIMLSLWISRQFEASMHLLAGYVLLFKASWWYKGVQSEWIQEEMNKIPTGPFYGSLQSSCSHGSRDSFVGSLIFNMTVMIGLNGIILFLGFCANQQVSGALTGRRKTLDLISKNENDKEDAFPLISDVRAKAPIDNNDSYEMNDTATVPK